MGTSPGDCGQLCSEEFWKGDVTIASVQAELGRGADPAAEGESGYPALVLAIWYSSDPEIVRLLLEAGADPILKDDDSGETLVSSFVISIVTLPNPVNAEEFPGSVDDFTANAVEILELLLEYGADAGARDESGQSALFSYFAVLVEELVNWEQIYDPVPPDPRIVELLLAHGAELSPEHESDASVITYAMFAGADAETIKLLLDHGAGGASKGSFYGDIGLLHLAAEFTADAQVFKLLLESGEDATAKGPNDWTVLHLAVRNGDLDPEAIRLLLDAGADVGARGDDGDTPLHHAASHSGPEAVRLLLERGADVAAQDRRMETPLHTATSDGYRWAGDPRVANAEVIAVLLAHGADVNARDGGGSTPLHSAALHQRTDTTRLLLKSGADINAADWSGNTPLHLAARLRESWEYLLPKVEVGFIRLLLDAGADASIKNNDGDAACDVASEDNKEVRALLCR